MDNTLPFRFGASIESIPQHDRSRQPVPVRRLGDTMEQARGVASRLRTRSSFRVSETRLTTLPESTRSLIRPEAVSRCDLLNASDATTPRALRAASLSAAPLGLKCLPPPLAKSRRWPRSVRSHPRGRVELPESQRDRATRSRRQAVPRSRVPSNPSAHGAQRPSGRERKG